MSKPKQNEVFYQVIMHHIHHYKEVKKIFKIDYDSQMVLVAVFAQSLYETLNPSLRKSVNEGLEWNEMFPVIKGLSKKNKTYKTKLSIFSVAQVLDMPKESVRRKVKELCKKKYLDYSISEGLSLGDTFETLARKIAPKDISALAKVIKSVAANGGIDFLLKSIR
tara:strand:- start:28 stop:522 length:495 start_codon:yes stop_codon:yes gene_type:complete